MSQGFEFHDRLMYLSKSMGHSKLESTRYYYSIVPALAQVLDEKTGESSDWMIPEVPEDEKANEGKHKDFRVHKCSPQSCNNRLASIRVFLKYLGSRDVSYLVLYHEATDIPRMKCRKTQVRGISKEAAKALMETPDASTRIGRRDMALIILLYSTAARLDEILDMKNSQLHLTTEKPYATIIGKGNKARTLYLLPKVVAHTLNDI